MFLSLFIILFGGLMGGLIFEKLRLPKLVWYLILGILLGPSFLNIVDESLLGISAILRQIALVIILTRSGLSLDLKTLKEIGRPAILMCFIPATFEIIGVTILAPLLLHISYMEALLLGSVLAAVSPAVVVPRMISLKERRYGETNHVPELIMAGSSCDDIYVIILFYAFKNLVASNNFSGITLLQIPTSIILGIAVGLLVGLVVTLLFKRLKLTTPLKIIITLSLSFGLLALEEVVKPYVSVSALLAIIVVGLIINIKNKAEAKEIQKGYNSLWNGFEILLFTLVGCATNAKLAFSQEGLVILGVIILALMMRSLGVLVCVIMTKYNWQEKIFLIISYLPKATVQASIGGIALAEGLACGSLILTAAVISILVTAPIGAILIDSLASRLLKPTLDLE